MANMVLVHGAFQGGWVWNKILPALKAAGHNVYCPTLTGLGSRNLELTKDIGLDHHIADICKIIDENNLSEVILIGHSYGGIVVSGVVQARASKIKALLYLDAPIPETNQSLLDVLGSEVAQIFYSNAQDGWRIDSFPAAAFGLEKENDINWAFPQHTAQSLKSFTDKVTILNSNEASHLKIGYIFCAPGNSFTQAQMKKAQMQGWNVYQIKTPHSPMITHQELLIELLCKEILI